MAQEADSAPNLDDGELWLPSDVLSDEEDFYMLTLAERVARSMLDDDEKGSNQSTGMSMSPKSTLCWSSGSGSRVSSNGSSQISSPSCTPTEHRSDAWDLLYPAAGEAESSVSEVNWKRDTVPTKPVLQKDFQTIDYSVSGIPSRWACRDKVANSPQVVQGSWSPLTGSENPTVPAQQHLQPKSCSISGWGQQTRTTPVQQMQARPGQKSAGTVRSADHSYPSWPPIQVGGSGMQAVFLGSNGSGRESGGTGVFLPRRVGKGSDSKKKKPAYSTVLLPYKVVHALNLHVEYMRSKSILHDSGTSKPASSPGRKQIENNESVCGDVWSEHQKKSSYTVCPKIQATSSEISLPADWTY
eukprot:Gb_08953 [translate_table: standard]